MMKLITFLFVLSISLSLTKKKHSKGHHSTLAESSFYEELRHSLSDENNSRGKRYKISKGSHVHRHHAYFNFEGILRRTFAIKLSSLNSGSNAVCSPVSALLPLGKLILGAKGQTRKELTDVIGVFKKSDLKNNFTALIRNLQYVPGVKLDVASRIYVAEDVELVPKFTEAAKEIFHSGVVKISFKEPNHAADEINGWVSRQTNGMIPLLLQPSLIDPQSSLIIVNAVYFKGKWKDPFKEINVGNFYASSGPKKIQLMSHHTTCRYTKSDILNAEIIEIPYEGSEAHFVIVLPLEKGDLPLLLNQLNLAPNLLNSALKHLNTQLVNLTIPKFSITTSFDLKDMYQKIGLNNMMSSKSGLKNIVKNQELAVSSATQMAVLEVHERGTEATAASAVNAIPMSAMLARATFRADHPFLFYIQANAEQLFAGIYSDP